MTRIKTFRTSTRPSWRAAAVVVLFSTASLAHGPKGHGAAASPKKVTPKTGHPTQQPEGQGPTQGQQGDTKLPAGFSVMDLPSGQSELLTDFAFTPDGGYFTSGKNGRFAWVSPLGEARTLVTLPVVTVQDLGFNGVAVAPDYATSRTVYTTRTLDVDGVWMMRLSAWRASGSAEPTGVTDERTIIELPSNSDVHGMTTVYPHSDGTLWLSIGDSADFRTVDPEALRALDLNEGYGKLLHITQTGEGVSTNPFFDAQNPSSWKSRVYASGFRSPFRFSLDPTDGTPILGDVGWSLWEEVNRVRAGASYGWPCWEGNTQTAGYKDLEGCQGVGHTAPLWTYVHGPLGTSITGGIVYNGESYPQEYRGRYFFADYASQRIYTLRYGPQGQLMQEPEAAGFGSAIGAPVRLVQGPNSDIYYADIMGSTVKRLVHGSGNRPPTAHFDLSSDAATRTVSVDARRSKDLDGDALTYAWDFGDGAKATGVRATHTYAAPATTAVTIRLVVTDPAGLEAATTMKIVPANFSPTMTLTTPPADQTFRVAEKVAVSAVATDPEDGELEVHWQVVLVHCSGGYCHDHPGETGTGNSFSKLFDDHGDDTSLEITASATDRHGVVVKQTYVAKPLLRNLTVNSNTPAAIAVNGNARNVSPITVGARVSLVAPNLASDGVATFERWLDGAPRERVITMPDGEAEYVAEYLTPMYRRYTSDAALRERLGAPKGEEQGDGVIRFRDFANARLYWSARSGIRVLDGEILTAYLAAGGHTRFGEPSTDVVTLPDGARKVVFANLNGARDIDAFWTSKTGAHFVYGIIGQRYRELGAEKSPLGYPTSDEQGTAAGGGRYNTFQNGAIYWRPVVGASDVRDSLYRKWQQLGGVTGPLGFPYRGEQRASDGTTRFNDFDGGVVYRLSDTKTVALTGALSKKWVQLGREKSCLGLPTGDISTGNAGETAEFQNGTLTLNAATGEVVSSCSNPPQQQQRRRP